MTPFDDSSRGVDLNLERVGFRLPLATSKVWVRNLRASSCCLNRAGDEETQIHFQTCKNGVRFVQLVEDYMSQVGMVVDLVVFLNPQQKSTSALVSYANGDAAGRAIRSLNDTFVSGRRIRVMNYTATAASEKWRNFTKVGKRERQCTKLANRLFGFQGWSSVILKVNVVTIESIAGLWCVEAETEVDIVVKCGNGVLLEDDMVVRQLGKASCTHVSKTEAISHSRKESKSIALVCAFERIVVATTFGQNTGKVVIPMVSGGATQI